MIDHKYSGPLLVYSLLYIIRNAAPDPISKLSIIFWLTLINTQNIPNTLPTHKRPYQVVRSWSSPTNCLSKSYKSMPYQLQDPNRNSNTALHNPIISQAVPYSPAVIHNSQPGHEMATPNDLEPAAAAGLHRMGAPQPNLQLEHQDDPGDVFKKSLRSFTKVIQYSPAMGIPAVLLVYIGCLSPFSYQGVRGNDSDPKLDEVSFLYEPALFLPWLFSVNTIMLDICLYGRDNKGVHKRPHWMVDKSRLTMVITYGLIAYVHFLVLAWKNDLGPSVAAARYVSDKAFESTALCYTLSLWQEYMNRRLRIPSNTANALYLYWPPFVYVFAFASGRCLQHSAKDAYSIPLEHNDFRLVWEPLIPRHLRALAVLVGALYGCGTTRGGFWRRLTFGFNKTVWMALVFLHSGLFGTISPFRLTAKNPKDIAQCSPLAFVVLVSLWVYCHEAKRLPGAIKVRFLNVFDWTHLDNQHQ